MGSEYQQLQNTIRKRQLSDRVRLISISFDPADSREDLARYGQRFRADPDIWDFYGAPTGSGHAALLDALGIVGVHEPLGPFVRNSAYHVVTPDGWPAFHVCYGAPPAAWCVALRFWVSDR